MTILGLDDFKTFLRDITDGKYEGVELKDILVTLYSDGGIEFNAEPDTYSITRKDDNTLVIVGDWGKIFTVSSYDNNCEVLKEVIDHYWNEEGIYLGNAPAPLQCNAIELSWMIE